jgi:molybdate transport system substrate-binding protein
VTRAVVAVLLAGLALAGCGDDERSAAAGGTERVVVSAAASLKTALTVYGDAFEGGTVRCRSPARTSSPPRSARGIEPDVFAAANTKLPEQLFARASSSARPLRHQRARARRARGQRRGAVPRRPHRGRGDDRDGGGWGPVGEYTRTVLDRLPPDRSAAILANVRSKEPDVGGIVGKLTQNAVDAGFVYRSDVEGAGGKLEAIELPEELKPAVAYGVALVKGAPNPSGGKAFVDGLLDGAGAQALRDSGFGPPGGG